MPTESHKKLFNHTIINLLNSFSKKEICRFSLFLENNLFNSDPRIIALFDSLVNRILYKKEVNKPILIKVFCEIFQPKKEIAILSPSQKKKLYTKMSLLNTLAKKFLAIEYLEKEELTQIDLQYKALLKKDQLFICKRALKKDRANLNNESIRSLNYYTKSCRVEENYLKYLHQDGKLMEEDNIKELNFNLDMYYLINKYQLYNVQLSLQKMKNNQCYDDETLIAVNNLQKLPQYSSQPVLKIYDTIIQLNSTNEESFYFRLLDLLNEYQENFSKEDLNEFYNVATNFCMAKIRQGLLHYNDLVFELFQRMELKNLFLIEGIMSSRRLRNIISQSCKVGNFEWAKTMIEKYIPYISSKDKVNVYHFNLGAIAFYEADYKTALHHLIRLNDTNLGFYDINSRMLLLKTYYKLDKDYDEKTMRIFRNSEQHINNNKKLPSAHKTGYKNFVRLLINLYKVRHQVGKVTIEKLEVKIESQQLISDKTWLIRMVVELNIKKSGRVLEV